MGSAIVYMQLRRILLRLAWLRRVEVRGYDLSANGKLAGRGGRIVPYLGDSRRAVPEAIEGARRAQTRPGKHCGRAIPSLVRSNMRRRDGEVVLGVGGQKGSSRDH